MYLLWKGNWHDLFLCLPFFETFEIGVCRGIIQWFCHQVCKLNCHCFCFYRYWLLFFFLFPEEVRNGLVCSHHCLLGFCLVDSSTLTGCERLDAWAGSIIGSTSILEIIGLFCCFGWGEGVVGCTFATGSDAVWWGLFCTAILLGNSVVVTVVAEA